MSDLYYEKYLKYKTKYLNLKNELNQEGGITLKSGIYYIFCRNDHAKKIIKGYGDEISSIKDINIILGATNDVIGNVAYTAVQVLEVAGEIASIFDSPPPRIYSYNTLPNSTNSSSGQLTHETGTPSGYAYRIKEGGKFLDLMRTKISMAKDDSIFSNLKKWKEKMISKLKDKFPDKIKKLADDKLFFSEKSLTPLANIGSIHTENNIQGTIKLDRSFSDADIEPVLLALNKYNKDIDTCIKIKVNTLKENKFISISYLVDGTVTTRTTKQ